MPDSHFITQGFDGIISPVVRTTHEVLVGWNLIVLAVVLLLVVLNKQLYPRQFRQLLSVPSGISSTNQLLREWTPTRSFMGFAFLISYIYVMTLFVQKSCVILSRDVVLYNSFNTFCIISGLVALWVLGRYLALAFIGWMFRQGELILRQITIELSVSSYCFMVMLPILLLVLYIPNSIFVWIGIAVIFLSAFLKLVLQLVDTRVFSKMPTIYIFLYFCTLEIAPLVLVLVAGLRYFAHSTVF